MTDKPTRSYGDKQVSLPASLVLSVVTLLVGAGGGATLDRYAGSNELSQEVRSLKDAVHRLELKLERSNNLEQIVKDHEQRLRRLEAR